jgi:hypothetical protein
MEQIPDLLLAMQNEVKAKMDENMEMKEKITAKLEVAIRTSQEKIDANQEQIMAKMKAEVETNREVVKQARRRTRGDESPDGFSCLHD